jgi:hypothetical protein
MSDKNLDRYFLDVRSGCAAIRDRHHKNFDPTYPGLHEDTPDVVKYIHGKRTSSGWTLDSKELGMLEELKEKLNIWPARDKILNELGIP